MDPFNSNSATDYGVRRWPAPRLWPLPLPCDLEHLQCVACDVMKLCTEFERNRTIRGGVIALSVFDLMTKGADFC